MKNEDNTRTITYPLFAGIVSVQEILVIGVFLCMLYLISRADFLLFHSIAELASIGVAFSIFAIIWNSRRFIPDGFFLIVGISFLFVGGIDLVHTLAYKGIGIFPGDNADLPTQLWIAARYFQSISFLVASFFIGRAITREKKYDTAIVVALCSLAAILTFASIFLWQNFPRCFIEGIGLTPFKIASEYIICAILIATTLILFWKRDHFDPVVFRLLIFAQVFLIFGELVFTSYVSVYGEMNIVGHLFRLLSIYFFYKVFVVISISRPYDLLLREFKRNEDNLRRSEENYRTLFDNMQEGLAYCRMIYDEAGQPADWVYIDVNKRFGELPGLSDIKGKHVLEAIPDTRELTPELFDTYGRVTSTGVPETFEIDFKPLKMWLRVSVYSPEKGFFVAVFDDISAQKHAEETLRKARDFYLMILDDFPNPIWRAGSDGKCDYFNKDWLEFTGRTLEQEMGDGWADGVHPDDLDRCLTIYQTAFANREPFDMEYRLRYHDGTYRWISDSGKPFYTPEGEFAGYIGSCYDIHARNLAEEALRQANDKLNLLASITRHDIKNQIFTLRAYLDFSKESRGDALKTTEYIIKEERAIDAIERQIAFTKEYEDLGVKAPVWQSIESCIKDATAALPMRDITIDNGVSDLEVYADPLFPKVFYNLIDNALRYGGASMTHIGE
ncbi:MAG: putative diguanylate cyclase [Methanoregulaceae archaeon PtaB.Bin108]|nr:MAG: putative diguanylate cyclase [Methanoregulaceae archaeon PtaB.Bin108]